MIDGANSVGIWVFINPDKRMAIMREVIMTDARGTIFLLLTMILCCCFS